MNMKIYKYISLVLCTVSYMQNMVGSSPSSTQTQRKQEKTNTEKPGKSTQNKFADEAQQQPCTPPAMWHSLVAGSVAGITEVGLAGHALSYGINRSMQGERFTLDRSKWSQPKIMSLHPADVYRGIETSAAGMAAITALQMTLNAGVQRMYQAKLNRELNESEKLVPAFCAGVAGAAVATPQEGIPNYQQNIKKNEKRELNSLQAVREIQTKQGRMMLWRGFTPTGIRDGKFTIGYKLLPNMIENRAKQVFGNNEVTNMGSKITAGVATAIATHPWHVIARHMQNKPSLSTTAHAARDIYQDQGMQGFTRGLVPRGIRVMYAIPMLSWAETQVMNQLLKKDKK